MNELMKFLKCPVSVNINVKIEFSVTHKNTIDSCVYSEMV